MNEDKSMGRQSGRHIREALHYYASIVIAGLGILVSLAIVVLPHTGLAEQAKGFLEHSNEFLIPLGVAVMSAFYLLTLYGQKEISEEIRHLAEVVGNPDSRVWQQQIMHSLPNNMREVFSHELDVFFEGLRKATNNQRIELKQRSLESRFIQAYRQTLLKLAGSTFWATALATRDYWKPYECLFAEFKAFIESGGKMNRVFFVDDPDHLTFEECETILRQASIGVDVYITSLSEAEADGRVAFFVVENNALVSWEVQFSIDGSARTKMIVANFNNQEVSNCLQVSKAIFRTARRLTVSELETALNKAKDRADKKRRQRKVGYIETANPTLPTNHSSKDSSQTSTS